MRNCDRQRTCDNKGISSIHTFRTPFRSEIGSLYCGSIFAPPSKRKNPANLTACGGSWSWQCDSNTRPADYESAALPTELCQHLYATRLLYRMKRKLSRGLSKNIKIFLSRSFSIRRGREAGLSENVESCTEMANPHRGLLETPGIMMYNTYLEARDGIQM